MSDWNVNKENPDLKVPKVDWGYVPVDPDSNFSASENQRVIDEVIKENELNRKRKEKEFKDKSGERISAVASYVKQLAKTGENTSVEGYFGKRYLAYLRGEEIINRLRYAKENQATEKTRG